MLNGLQRFTRELFQKALELPGGHFTITIPHTNGCAIPQRNDNPSWLSIHICGKRSICEGEGRLGSHLSFKADYAAKIIGLHHGDMAPMVIIEFVDRDVDAKGAGDKARVAAEDVAE